VSLRGGGDGGWGTWAAQKLLDTAVEAMKEQEALLVGQFVGVVNAKKAEIARLREELNATEKALQKIKKERLRDAAAAAAAAGVPGAGGSSKSGRAAAKRASESASAAVDSDVDDDDDDDGPVHRKRRTMSKDETDVSNSDDSDRDSDADDRRKAPRREGADGG
jgi:hypothetical protein